MRSNRDIAEAMAMKWERQAYDLERGADRPESDYSPIEKRMLRVQANVYRACANDVRNEGRKITRG